METEDIQITVTQRGGGTATIERKIERQRERERERKRAEAKATQILVTQRGRYGDNRESGHRCYTNNRGPEGAVRRQ